MPFTALVDTDNVPTDWRSLTDRLTAEQVQRLTAMEHHPAYTGRPRFLLLEALEYVQPGWAADYVAGRALRAL